MKYNLELLKDRKNLTVFSRFANDMGSEEEVIELLDKLVVEEEVSEDKITSDKSETDSNETVKKETSTTKDPDSNDDEGKDKTDANTVNENPTKPVDDNTDKSEKDSGDEKIEGLDVTVNNLEAEFQKAISGQKSDFVDFAKKYGIDIEEANTNEKRKLAITKWYNDQIN